MKKILLLLLLLLNKGLAEEEKDIYRIFFTDKVDTVLITNSKIYQETFQIHSGKCLKRRQKVLPTSSILTLEDAPIPQTYIDSIEKIGGKILLKLRWLNYVVAECDNSQITQISSLPFIKYIQKTALKPQLLINNENNPLKHSENYLLVLPNYCSSFNYGNSYYQNSLMETNKLHSKGITGEGVLIGFCDTGFRWKTHNALKNINVLKEWDFINNDSITANESEDQPNQDIHGTIVLSTASAYYPGKLIGIAPSSNYILSKTEDMRWERRIEEDAYAAAVEWMEAEGVDIISTSLGYSIFDSTEQSYNYSDLNGNTTLTARYVNLAVKKGVVFITAAGNGGPNAHTIITPADADSVIAVGAIRYDSLLVTNFSSRGPREDGRIKPDLTTLGEKVVAVNPDNPDEFIEAKGTSLATPLISSAIALILSAFPELTPWQVRELLFQNASRTQNPDNDYGYGIPNIYQAMKNYGIIISPVSYFRYKNSIRILVFIESRYKLNDCFVFLDFGNNTFNQFKLYKTLQEDLYATDIPLELFTQDLAKGYILANDYYSSRRMPYEQDKFFEIKTEQQKIICGIDQSLINYLENENWFSFIYPSVVSDKNTDVYLNVFLEEKSDITIEVFSARGDMCYKEKTQELPIGMSKIKIHTQNLASGAYFVRFSQKNNSQIFKFIIIF